MELEFDNEIDALLRKEAVARTITIGEFAGVHLDADEIAAFVENAVPSRTRSTFTRHFATCDRCRKSLSHAAALHAEQSEFAESIVAPSIETSVPWYRRLFLFPNLAYVMGGLIVMFAGFIGLSVYNSGTGGAFEVSKAVPSSAPAAAETEQHYASNSNAAPETMANTAANAEPTPEEMQSPDISDNGVILKKGPSPSAEDDVMRDAPSGAASRPTSRGDDEIVDRVENKQIENLPTDRRRVQEMRAEPKERAKEEQKPPGLMAPSAESSRNSQVTQNTQPKAKGPSTQRNDNRLNEQRNVQLSRSREADAALKSAPKKTDKASTSAGYNSGPQRVVGGKGFVLRQGVWYDTVYNGQGTINVRRNSVNYKKLDGGLRGIAESVPGTVVTVWNGKAYRID